MLDPGQTSGETQCALAGVNSLAQGQRRVEDYLTCALRNNLPTAMNGAVPTTAAPSASILPPASAPSITKKVTRTATISDPGHPVVEGQPQYAGSDLSYALLTFLADQVSDLEEVRKATENRLRSLVQIKGAEGTTFEAQQRLQLKSIKSMEAAAIRNLERAMADHPFGPWVAAHHGIGLKGVARLLGIIGDPASRPNVAKLWQYCGHGDPLRSRLRKGEPVTFSPEAKKRLWIVSSSASKQGHYRLVYVAAREACQGKVHGLECRNSMRPVGGQPVGSNGCATLAHPEWGEPGSSWRDGHKHAHALRIVGKTILLDLWVETRRVAS